MPKKYFTGNASVDSKIEYLQKQFPNSKPTRDYIKYLIEEWGASTSSGKAEQARTSARSQKKGK